MEQNKKRDSQFYIISCKNAFVLKNATATNEANATATNMKIIAERKKNTKQNI